MLKKGVILASILILSVGMAFATSTQEISETENAVRATITGTVTNADTGDAIAGADVTLTEADVSATTDEYGIFSFEEVEAGTYTLSVSADGFEATETEVEVTEEGANVTIELTPAL